MMKKIYNIRLLSLILLIISIGMFTSCEDDENKGSDAVQLLSFGPSGVQHGQKISLIGKNLDKVLAVLVTGDSIPKSEFSSQSSNLIEFVVPETAERGFITLVTADAKIISKSRLDLEVAPTISAVTASARPGENVTITGNYMNWVKSVKFVDDQIVYDTFFVSKSLTQLVVKVPEKAKTGILVLSYGGTKPKTIETTESLNVVLPVPTAISPNPIKHADNLTITGTNLDLATGVLFTGVANAITTFVSQSSTQIVVKVPAGAKAGKISVLAASKVSTSSTTDLTLTMPAATALTPNPVAPESNLTITGTNLDLVSGISFTGISSPVTTFVSQSATQLVLQVPAGSLKGKLILGVKNSTLTVETDVLDMLGGLPPLADFPLAIYTDATQNGFQDWSYTTVHDFNSTANVRQGSKSIKAEYGGNTYQGVTFHNGTPVSTAGYTKLEFSVFGEAGTAGKKINIILNGDYSFQPQVTVVGGEWTTYSLSLESLKNPATIGEIVLQSAGWTGVLHIDHVGLR